MRVFLPDTWVECQCHICPLTFLCTFVLILKSTQTAATIPNLWKIIMLLETEKQGKEKKEAVNQTVGYILLLTCQKSPFPGCLMMFRTVTLWLGQVLGLQKSPSNDGSYHSDSLQIWSFTVGSMVQLDCLLLNSSFFFSVWPLSLSASMSPLPYGLPVCPFLCVFITSLSF